MTARGRRRASIRRGVTGEKVTPGTLFDAGSVTKPVFAFAVLRGLGFQLKHSPYGTVFDHGGSNGGFECNFEIYRDLGIGYVYFTNSNTGNRIRNAMRELLITGKRKAR